MSQRVPPRPSWKEAGKTLTTSGEVSRRGRALGIAYTRQKGYHYEFPPKEHERSWRSWLIKRNFKTEEEAIASLLEQKASGRYTWIQFP